MYSELLFCERERQREIVAKNYSKSLIWTYFGLLGMVFFIVLFFPRIYLSCRFMYPFVHLMYTLYSL